MMTSSLPSSAVIVPSGGGVAGGKSERGFGAFESGERFFQFMMRRERTADQPGGARSRAELFDGFDGGFLERG